MRDEFPGFYSPTQKEYDELWTQGIISFDANAMLNVYKYSAGTLQTFLHLLEQLRDQLWLTHQAIFEYHKNRSPRIEHQLQLLEHPPFEEHLRKARASIQKLHHPILDLNKVDTAIEDLLEQTDLYRKDSDLKAKYELRCSEVMEKMSQIFSGKIGEPYEYQIKQEKYESAKTRYERQIPPGYADWDEKQKTISADSFQADPYGDALIWFQLLERARQVGKPIIFVTDENKPDWWFRQSGKTLGPRPELIEEMKTVGVKFWLYSSTSFLEIAPRYAKEAPPEEEIKSAVAESKAMAESQSDVSLQEILQTEQVLSSKLIKMNRTQELPFAEEQHPMSLCSRLMNDSNCNLHDTFLLLNDIEKYKSSGIRPQREEFFSRFDRAKDQITNETWAIVVSIHNRN